MEKRVDKAHIHLLMEMFMLEIGKMIKCQEKAHIHLKTEIHM